MHLGHTAGRRRAAERAQTAPVHVRGQLAVLLLPFEASACVSGGTWVRERSVRMTSSSLSRAVRSSGVSRSKARRWQIRPINLASFMAGFSVVSLADQNFDFVLFDDAEVPRPTFSMAAVTSRATPSLAIVSLPTMSSEGRSCRQRQSTATVDHQHRANPLRDSSSRYTRRRRRPGSHEDGAEVGCQ